MNFVHLSLLAGGALAVIPVVMHMMARATPKKLDFPALRFVRQTAINAERGWKVKRWLLLSMRGGLILLAAALFAAPHVHTAMLATTICIGLLALVAILAIAVFVVALATRRPAVVLICSGILAACLTAGATGWGILAAQSGLSPPVQTASGPIATAIIIDTSPTMDYANENKTRLEKAKEISDWLIERMPVGSQVAIVTSNTAIRLSQDLAGAKRQVSRLEISGASSELAQQITESIDTLRSSELQRRELYVLTDLNQSAWKETAATNLKEMIAEEPEVLVQIVDVGLEDSLDWAITDLKLSQESLLPGGNVTVEAKVRASDSAPKSQLEIELSLEEIDPSLPIRKDGKVLLPKSSVKDGQIVELEPGGSASVRFQIRDLQLGTHHAMVRIVRPDPLAVNNSLHLAVDCQNQGRVLVAAKDASLARLLRAMIAPQDVSEDVNQQTEHVDYFSLDTINLTQYSAIILFDPVNINGQLVDKLKTYVESGGGVFIILGAANSDAEMIQSSELSKLLPGEVTRISRYSESDLAATLDPVLFSHPVFELFGQSLRDVNWARYHIYRHWDFDELDASASAIINYTISGKPMLIEHNLGGGKIVTLTTPLPEPPNPQDRLPWNDLITTADAWESFALINGAVRYLSGWGKAKLNYSIGQSALLTNNEELPSTYEMFTPKGDVIRIDALKGSIAVPQIDSVGHYRLRGFFQGTPFVRGFTANLNSSDTVLSRVDELRLNEILGESNFRLANNTDQLVSSIGDARFGRALYPFILCILLMLWIGEQLMSTRFYSLRLSPKAT